MNRKTKHMTKKALAFLLAMIMTLSMLPLTASAYTAPHLSKTKLTITVGKTAKLYAKGSYIKKVRFSSTNKSIVTVTRSGKTGTVKARKKGSAKIKVVFTYRKSKKSTRYYTKTLYCRVTVKAKTTSTGSSEKPETGETGSVGPIIIGPESPKEEETIQSSADFVEQTANFSIDLFKRATKDALAKGKNVLISAESILSAMLMTSNGAAGDTLAQMQKVLTGDVDYETYLEAFKAYNDDLAASKNVIFHQANSIWAKNDADLLQVKDSFLETNKKYFNADFYLEPFDFETVKKINAWVKTNTNDMIPEVIDELDKDTVMCLINALAFEGKWAEPYEDYQMLKSQSFTTSTGEVQKVTMLNEATTRYLKDDKALGFAKNYMGDKYAFVAIRPNDGVSVADYLADMTGESFLKFYNSRVSGKAYTRIPKFSYDDNYSLNSTLQSMGIVDAFSKDAADFSNMATLPEDYRLYIGDVIHKTHIELDENGTKAAAVTAVVMKATSSAPTEEPIEIYLDKPFIYAIVDTTTGLPIFMGAVNSIN